MEKTRVNYIIDFLMALSFLVTAITGLIIFLFLPSGIRKGSTQSFLGIIKGTWSTIHDWSGIIFIVLVNTFYLALELDSFYDKKYI